MFILDENVAIANAIAIAKNVFSIDRKCFG